MGPIVTEKLKPGLLLHPVDCLALGCGSGLVPIAPGTAGTLVAIPVYLLLQSLSLVFYIPLVAGLFLLGIPICAHTAKRLGVHDHPGIVWDEIVGFLVTMTFAPPGWVWIATGFVLFRGFDVIKPWPIGWCDQRVLGGFGIMLDDLLAALMAAGVLQLFVIFL